MKLHRQICLLLILVLVFTSGCAAFLLGGAAAGTAALYHYGELQATRNVTLPRAYNASLNALNELGIVVVNKEKDGLSALIIGHGAENKKINIQLRKIFDDVTEINIRIGTFGDELQSRLVFERIEKHLSGRMTGEGVSPQLP